MTASESELTAQLFAALLILIFGRDQIRGIDREG